jgi:hypothetical protein
MTFTSTPPNRPGFYAWKLFDKDIPKLTWVLPGDDGVLWRDGKAITTNGLWCRLVPAEEVEKAYKEAIGEFEKNAQWWWERSNAKKVCECKKV